LSLAGCQTAQGKDNLVKRPEDGAPDDKNANNDTDHETDNADYGKLYDRVLFHLFSGTRDLDCISLELTELVFQRVSQVHFDRRDVRQFFQHGVDIAGDEKVERFHGECLVGLMLDLEFVDVREQRNQLGLFLGGRGMLNRRFRQFDGSGERGFDNRIEIVELLDRIFEFLAQFRMVGKGFAGCQGMLKGDRLIKLAQCDDG